MCFCAFEGSCLCRETLHLTSWLGFVTWCWKKNEKKHLLWPEANYIKSNTGRAVLVVVVAVVDTCLNPFCSNVHITSPPHTADACPNRTTNGCHPALFNMVWDRALLLSLLCKSTVTNAVRPDKKRQHPLIPRPWRAETECDAATHKPVGYQPYCAHTPWARAKRRRYGTYLWDSFLVPLVVPPRLSAQGQGAGTSVGRRGWTRVGGWQHRSILGRWWIIIVSRLTLSLTITKPLADVPCISVCVIPQKLHWMCGLGIELAHAHCTSEHTLSHSHKHTLSHAQTHCHHYRRFSANLHIGLWVVQLFVADCVWEGQSHRR